MCFYLLGLYRTPEFVFVKAEAPKLFSIKNTTTCVLINCKNKSLFLGNISYIISLIFSKNKILLCQKVIKIFNLFSYSISIYAEHK